MTVRTGGPAQDVYVVGGDSSGSGAAATISGPLGRKADTASVSVALSTEDVALIASLNRSATAVKSSIAGNAGSVTILASNANRLGASVYNDSGAILYLDMSGGTATLTSYTLQIAPNGYFEVPFSYTGLITGIWGSATGSARITEYT